MTIKTIRKSLLIEKMDEAGTGLARIATLSAVDSDGDTYAPGAFSWKQGGGQWVQILPAHDRRHLPLGKAWLYEDGDAALAKLQFNLDTQAAKDWHSALKFDLANGSPIQEWSYGFQVLDAGMEQRAGEQVRVLKRLDVDEVSPVVRGAGAGTGTISIKGAALKDDRFVALITGLDEMAGTIVDDPTLLSATGRKQLAQIHAALGKALAPEVDSADAAAVEHAVADYYRTLSRRHLLA